MGVFDLELLKDVIKRSPATTLFVFLLVLSFIASYIWGNGPTDFETARLFGSIIPPDATTDGLIRTITYTFHQIGGPIHLLMNLGAILVTGPFLERVYGPIKYTAFFLITGMFGGLFVLIFTEVNTIVGGASGSGYGLMGLYVGLILKKDPWIDQTTRNWVWNMLWANMVWTFFIPGISIAGHMGGLISGIIIAAIFKTHQEVDENWVTSFIKSIITFIGIVIMTCIPKILYPNIALPFIQDMRNKTGNEVMYLSSNYYSDKLIYNLDRLLAGQNQKQLLSFVNGSVIEIIISVLLLWIIYWIIKTFLTSWKLRGLIKNGYYYKQAKKTKYNQSIIQLGHDVVREYKQKKNKINHNTLMKKVEFELQLIFGTAFQKAKNSVIRIVQFMVLIVSSLLLFIFISMINDIKNEQPMLHEGNDQNKDQSISDKISQTTEKKVEKDNTKVQSDRKKITTLYNNDEPELSGLNSDYFIPNDMGDFMLVEYPNTSVYAIFNDNSFTDLNIEVRARSIFISGYYKGEIMPGRSSYLEFILIPEFDDYFSVHRILYDGEILENQKDIYSIINYITTPLNY
ncbi:rhomboid family intramembrane serine protease [Lysinibacillus sp. JK80]|uniref:rhomboid family intramembrane serine protease n=1 Tax=Lysinibacillus sp. JK80 TaxID=2749809 RepID=UPI0022B9A26F|nr:rhomboid family intramembrane serine protease [Lysinibacillus sp. JK80]WBF57669.1 rhomboid family intramembrane serine protease [Lysinibacillus sp. JK80]